MSTTFNSWQITSKLNKQGKRVITLRKCLRGTNVKVVVCKHLDHPNPCVRGHSTNGEVNPLIITVSQNGTSLWLPNEFSEMCLAIQHALRKLGWSVQR
jgi:hypothetical protein